MRFFISNINTNIETPAVPITPDFSYLLPNITGSGDFSYITAPLTKVRFYNGLFYMIIGFKSSHVTQTSGTLLNLYKLDPAVEVWELVTTIDTVSSTISVYGGGFDIMPNGDFLLGIEYSGVEFREYRSIDNGLSWTSERMLKTSGGTVDVGGSTGYSPVGLFSTGTSVIMGVIDSPPQIIRNSDVNGVNGNWDVINMVLGSGIDGSPAEPNFIKCADGTIVSIWRRDIGVLVTNPGTPLFSISNDDGVTWSDLDYCNVDYFYRTNISLVHHVNTGYIEVFASARTVDDLGSGTIWYSITNETDIKNGNLGTPIAIGSGSAGQDFGNQGASIADDGTLLMAYVDRANYGLGASGITELYTMIGRR